MLKEAKEIEDQDLIEMISKKINKLNQLKVKRDLENKTTMQILEKIIDPPRGLAPRRVKRDLVKCYGFSFESHSKRQARIHEPKIGDLVVEHSNPFSSINSVGKIIDIRDGKQTKEYDIELFDGRTITWRNAGFYRIPTKKEALDW